MMLSVSSSRIAPGIWDLEGLSQAEKQEATLLVMRLGRFTPRNHERTLWYDAKHAVQHLGIAVPQQLEEIAPVLGWPARAVDDLADRVILDGFVAPGDTWEQFGLEDIWSSNRLPLLSSMVHTSAFKYSVNFVGAIRGGSGEPDVLTPAYSATTSTGRWDPVMGRLKSFLTLTDKDQFGNVTGFILATERDVIRCKTEGKSWSVERRAHGAGRCPFVPFVHNPSVEWEFGTSRITRPVMSIAQRAIRTLLRMEVTAEFFSSPQRAVLGASESDFVDSATGKMKTGWEVTIGKLLALSRDENSGELPSVHQFAQATMQPHVEMVRADAALFSGETGIPVDTLGVIHDNPSSASGVDARYKKLNATAEKAIKSFEGQWADLMRIAVMVREGDSRAAQGLSQLSANFRPPHAPTIGEASDAIVKQVAAMPWLAESAVTLRRLGYSKAEIDELLEDKRRAQADSRLRQLVEVARAQVSGGDSNSGGGVSGSVAGLGAAGSTGSV